MTIRMALTELDEIDRLRTELLRRAAAWGWKAARVQHWPRGDAFGVGALARATIAEGVAIGPRSSEALGLTEASALSRLVDAFALPEPRAAEPEPELTPSAAPARGFAAVGLHLPKTAHNVGAVLRAAACWGVAMVAVTGRRYDRAGTDTMRAHEALPLLHCDDLHAVVPFGCVPVAVELVDDAVSLVDYVHPPRAFYVFGPEDSSLGRSVLSWCRDRVRLPSNGCLNLAACANVVLYDRAAKAARR